MATIELSVECDVRGKKLEATQYGTTLCVEPCEKFIEAAKEEARQEAEDV